MEFVLASDRSVLVRTADPIPLLHVLEQDPIPGVINLHPAYESILLVFDPLQAGHDPIIEEVRNRARRAHPIAFTRTFRIAVRYNGADLDFVAEFHGLTHAEVIDLHSSRTYTVRFLGFLPGFAYLSGLLPELATPRLSSPRIEVPAGSVAIGGSQTGVYPLATPGGWRLIGHTEEEMFRLDRPGLSLLRPGDRVRFLPV